ncbi:LysR family transcriptional regulator [Pelosinus sp. UFO1]|uniref:LysR family transcriptional regulator n=1 Tax=Pelosinus sp. UFO1 TaxID=484770 RepID=UPI0004D1020F|nr:LysR family transcriptional regulator [Pelosinus sp. UFO1]AIF51675.1 transcriptional regulator, LysR family [Pelosinus sp. UFO1]
MDIQLFQTFLLVAKLGSITQTAEQLNFTQPTVSAQINTLEKHFNVLLFERVRKKLYITEAGREMVVYAEKMLNLYREIKETMNSHAIDNNRIIIASSTQLINYLLPDILRNFHDNNPNNYVSVEICRNTKAVEKGLLDNTFDIGIVHDQIASDHLKYIEILQEELIWVGHNELIKNDHIDHFTDYSIIQFRFGSDMRRKVEEAIKGHKYRQMIEYSDAEAILRAVADKLGVALLPQIMVQSFLDQGIFVKLTHTEPIKCPISVVIHKNKNITPSHKSFLNSAFSYAQKEQLLNKLI